MLLHRSGVCGCAGPGRSDFGNGRISGPSPDLLKKTSRYKLMIVTQLRAMSHITKKWERELAGQRWLVGLVGPSKNMLLACGPSNVLKNSSMKSETYLHPCAMIKLHITKYPAVFITLFTVKGWLWTFLPIVVMGNGKQHHVMPHNILQTKPGIACNTPILMPKITVWAPLLHTVTHCWRLWSFFCMLCLFALL